jgi:Tol biopolymer transport system component
LFTQITHDGRQKSLAGTDGSRLYFTDWARNWIAQVGINGGEIARVPVALPGAKVALIDISPDAASALIYTIEEGHYPNGQWVVPILGGAAKRLEDGAEAAFSPDGGSVIYSTLAGDIFMARIDGGEKHKLSSVGPQPFWIFPNPAMFQWSPDRKVIRFGQQDGLWEMSTDGARLHRLLSGLKRDVPVSGRWTRDGNFFVFVADNQIWALDERSGPFRRPSSAPIQLTSGPLQWARPVPGRDGRTIFAEGSTPKGELMRIDPKTGAAQPFLDGISAEFVAFSPDGNFVAYTTFPENTLWRANRDGSSRMQLTRPAPDVIFEPRWSPNSKEILFGMYSPSEDRDSMHRISASDGNPLWLRSEESENDDDPNWSPDGTKVVFAQGRKNAPEKMDIRIVDLNTRQVTIVPGSAGKWAPRWSPDGRYIAALVNPQVNHVPVFDLKLQRWFDIPVHGEVQYESFSHDGKFIYFMRYGRDQGVFRVPVTGGKEERVVNLAGWHLTSIWGYSMRLDPTDAPLVLRDASSDDIYALTLEAK